MMAVYNGRRAYAGFKKSYNTPAPSPPADPASGAARNPRLAAVLSLADGRSASAEGLSEADREHIRSTMGDTVRLDNDTYTHQYNESTTSNEQRGKTSGDSSGKAPSQEILHHRARSIFARSEAFLGRLRRDNHGAEEFFGTPVQETTREAWLGQLTAVAAGRKQLFHDTFPPEAASALGEMVHEVMPQVKTGV